MVLLVTGAGFRGEAAVVDWLRQLGGRIAPYTRGPGRVTGTAAITDDVFGAFGGTWAGFPETEGLASGLGDLAAGELGRRAHAIIDASGTPEQVVIADGHNGMQLPFWRAVFNDDLSVAHIVPPPTQVAGQMVKCGVLPAAAAYAVWEHQVQTAFRGADGLKNVLISLPELHQNASGKVLSALIGIDTPPIASGPRGTGFSDRGSELVAPIDDPPPSAAALWEYVQRNHLKPVDADGVPPSEVDAAVLETAIFAIQHAGTSSDAQPPSVELDRLRVDLNETRQQLERALERSSDLDDRQITPDAEIEALRARNHQLETARSIRLARLVGDPIRRVVRRLR